MNIFNKHTFLLASVGAAGLLVLLAYGIYKLEMMVWAPNRLTTSSQAAVQTLNINGYPIVAELAATPETLEKGLSGRGALSEGTGMLFVFPVEGQYAFWMKDMSFPIDIMWISATGTIIHMAEGVTPGSYPQDFAPPTPARYVLEVPSGWSEAHSVEVGDKVFPQGQ